LFCADVGDACVAAAVPAVAGCVAGVLVVPVHPAMPIAAQIRRITRKESLYCIPECTGRHYLIIALF
jgi:hypothetical protein